MDDIDSKISPQKIDSIKATVDSSPYRWYRNSQEFKKEDSVNNRHNKL